MADLGNHQAKGGKEINIEYQMPELPFQRFLELNVVHDLCMKLNL